MLRNSLSHCQDSPLLRTCCRPLSLPVNMAPVDTSDFLIACLRAKPHIKIQGYVRVY